MAAWLGESPSPLFVERRAGGIMKDWHESDPAKETWQVLTNDREDHVFTKHDHPRRICSVYGGIAHARGLRLARLISAAPELLRALEGFVDEECHCDESGQGKCVQCIGRAAIRKARGPKE